MRPLRSFLLERVPGLRAARSPRHHDGRDSVELACRGVQLCPEGCTVAVVGVDAAARNVEFAESNARQLRNRTGAPPPPFAF